MTRFAAINLAALPAPTAIEQIDVEAIIAEMKTSFLAVYDAYRNGNPNLPAIDTLHLETEPINILFQTMAYREVLVRQVGNDKYKASTLAYAIGTDLDNKVAELGVERKLLDIGDPNAVPPVPSVWESDDSLRFRAQLAWEALSTAGPEGAYIFHALTSHPDVLDARVFGPHSTELDEEDRPEPGDVLVTLLSREEGGEASSEVVAAVATYLAADNRRPLTDNVTVESATVEDYVVKATIYVRPGASAEVVREAAEAAAQAYVDDQFKIGAAVRLSRLAAALYVGDDTGQSPVENVDIEEPADDLVSGPRSAPKCTSVTVNVEVA